MGQDEPAVRGLTGDNDYAIAIQTHVTSLREHLHTARSAMEKADEAAARLRAAGEALSITQGHEFTAEVVALIEEAQRDTRDLMKGHRMRSLQVAQTATFVLDALRSLWRA